MEINFEEWLKNHWAENYAFGVLDDDMHDAFERYLENMDIDSWLDLGTKFGEAVNKKLI